MGTRTRSGSPSMLLLHENVRCAIRVSVARVLATRLLENSFGCVSSVNFAAKNDTVPWHE